MEQRNPLALMGFNEDEQNAIEKASQACSATGVPLSPVSIGLMVMTGYMESFKKWESINERIWLEQGIRTWWKPAIVLIGSILALLILLQ